MPSEHESFNTRMAKAMNDRDFQAYEALLTDDYVGEYPQSGEVIHGPKNARAIIEYQRDADLPPTGRLDMRTLADMNLLPPTRRVVVPAPAHPAPFDFDDEPPVIQRRVYRGIWIR